MSALLRAHVALFLVNALYGASHVIAKGVMPSYLSPNVFILFRAVGATLLFWIVKSMFKREKSINETSHFWLFVDFLESL